MPPTRDRAAAGESDDQRAPEPGLGCAHRTPGVPTRFRPQIRVEQSIVGPDPIGVGKVAELVVVDRHEPDDEEVSLATSRLTELQDVLRLERLVAGKRDGRKEWMQHEGEITGRVARLRDRDRRARVGLEKRERDPPLIRSRRQRLESQQLAEAASEGIEAHADEFLTVDERLRERGNPGILQVVMRDLDPDPHRVELAIGAQARMHEVGELREVTPFHEVVEDDLGHLDSRDDVVGKEDPTRAFHVGEIGRLDVRIRHEHAGRGIECGQTRRQDASRPLARATRRGHRPPILLGGRQEEEDRMTFGDRVALVRPLGFEPGGKRGAGERFGPRNALAVERDRRQIAVLGDEGPCREDRVERRFVGKGGEPEERLGSAASRQKNREGKRDRKYDPDSRT